MLPHQVERLFFNQINPLLGCPILIVNHARKHQSLPWWMSLHGLLEALGFYRL